MAHNGEVSVEQTSDPSPWALQLAVRVEKTDPPAIPAICAASALATIELLAVRRSHAGGEWHEAVAQWNGARIRKLVRRGRGSAWLRAQEPSGVTVERDGAEVRAFVPSPMDQAPAALAKLQIQSSPLDDVDPVGAVPDVTGLIIAVTPHVPMSWGKQAAQCAHAGQRAWMTADAGVAETWDWSGRPITVIWPSPTLWSELVEQAPVQIHDGGFTEIPAGTKTTVAWWGQHDHD